VLPQCTPVSLRVGGESFFVELVLIKHVVVLMTFGSLKAGTELLKWMCFILTFRVEVNVMFQEKAIRKGIFLSQGKNFKNQAL